MTIVTKNSILQKSRAFVQWNKMNNLNKNHRKVRFSLVWIDEIEKALIKMGKRNWTIAALDRESSYEGGQGSD